MRRSVPFALWGVLAGVSLTASLTAQAQTAPMQPLTQTAPQAEQNREQDAGQAPDYAPEAGATDMVGVDTGDFNAPSQLLVQQQNGIRFMTGGVGDEELAQMNAPQVRAAFSLRVLSTRKDGAFLGDYTLRVSDAQGHPLVSAAGDGPLFLLKLAPGTYRVAEDVAGRTTQEQTVKIGTAGRKEIRFTWLPSAGPQQ